MVTPAGVGVPEPPEALDSDEQILSLDLPRAQCHTVFKGGGGGANSTLQCRHAGIVQVRLDCM